MLRQQAGVGLLEVLIALLLLAVAVLGFSAMQMRAVKATDETLFRSDALVAIRNISEDLRLYPTESQREAYKKYISSLPSVEPKSCVGTTAACTEQEQMEFNAYQSLQLAKDNGITINAMDCPGINSASSLKKMCLIAAWGDTQATMSDDDNSCTNARGVYSPGATCFVVETY